MFQITVHVDIEKLEVKVEIRLFKLKILTITIYLLGMSYRINRSKKVKRFSIIISEKEKYLIKQIKKSILDKLYYDNFNLLAVVNVGEPYTTAMTIGLGWQVCEILQLYFKYTNKEYNLTYDISGDFVGSNNYISVEVKVYFTIFDLVFAIIMSFYRRGKYVKEKR